MTDIINADRLIEDKTRRREGAFFTPTLWADEAHKQIEKLYGPDWKEEYVVWDCACGVGNLTRDYKFKELYCSTIVQDELNNMIENGINPEATRFQHDFLQDFPELGAFDDYALWEDKLPSGLVKAFNEGKKILFLINPPYVAAANFNNSENLTSIAVNPINVEMRYNKLGKPSAQLYTQFMYKIARIQSYYNLDMNLAIFNKPNFLTGGSFKGFRTYWFDQFELAYGMLFQASNFSDVSTRWGILFSIWKSGKQPQRTEFPVEIKKQSQTKIEAVDIKVLYNFDDTTSASKWVQEETKGLKTDRDVPQLTSGTGVKTTGHTMRGSVIEGLSFGYFFNSGDNIYENDQSIALFSSAFSGGNGFSVIPDNFRKVTALFTARKTVTKKYANWINDKDEYMKPNTDHPNYEQWNNDAIVHSLFDISSQQSSLRDIEYKGKQWNIENEWFWMSHKVIKKLADFHNNQAVYDDCKTFGKERYVYTALKDLNLSQDASEVLGLAEELVSKSFKFRETMNEKHPEYHLNSWDIGWCQIVKILKEHLPDDLKAFRVKYKEFEDRMRPGVYEFGFLRE